MTLSRTEISAGLIGELDDFGRLVGSMDEPQLATATRCTGWTVADVSAHVIGAMTDVTQGRLEGLGSPEVTAREVEERRGRTSGELCEELAGATKASADMIACSTTRHGTRAAPGGSYAGTLGQGVEALWYDAYLHGDDIRRATGLPSERGPGLRASVHHVAAQLEQLGWGPATLAFDGIEPVPVSGGGPEVNGDALDFVLTATGRLDPAATGFEVPNIYG